MRSLSLSFTLKEWPCTDEMLDAAAFIQRSGFHAELLQLKRAAGDILALRGAGFEYRYPAWQIAGSARIVDGIAETLALAGGNAWIACRLLCECAGDRSGRKLHEVLRNGEKQAALADIRSRLAQAAA